MTKTVLIKQKYRQNLNFFKRKNKQVKLLQNLK